jgi:outer membrane protein assembly factor BamB
VGADGTIYIGSWNGNLYAINPDGSLRWKFATGSTVDSSPAIGNDGSLYFGSEDHNLYALGQQVPQTVNDCKAGGWRNFGFKNQGQCVAFVEHH